MKGENKLFVYFFLLLCLFCGSMNLWEFYNNNFFLSCLDQIWKIHWTKKDDIKYSVHFSKLPCSCLVCMGLTFGHTHKKTKMKCFAALIYLKLMYFCGIYNQSAPSFWYLPTTLNSPALNGKKTEFFIELKWKL